MNPELLIDDSEFQTPLYVSVPEFVRKYDAGQRRDAQGRWTEQATVTVGDRTITVVKPERAVRAGDKLVPVNVVAFDEAFAREGDFYLSVGGENGIGNRYARFGQFLAEHDSIEAAEVSVNEAGRVGFTNGRHRYAWLRDQGLTEIPVALDKESVEHAKRHGYLAAVKRAWDESLHPRNEDGEFIPKLGTIRQVSEGTGYSKKTHVVLRTPKGWQRINNFLVREGEPSGAVGDVIDISNMTVEGEFQSGVGDTIQHIFDLAALAPGARVVAESEVLGEAKEYVKEGDQWRTPEGTLVEYHHFNPKVFKIRVKKWDESEHPRNEEGEFTSKKMVALFKEKFSSVDDYGSTKFILPDGTRVGHRDDSHLAATKAIGVDLYDAMRASIIRYTPGTGAEIGGPMTKAQAQHLVDATVRSGGNNPLFVDVFRGKDRFAKVFDSDRATAATVRNWVNSHFTDKAKKSEHSYGNTQIQIDPTSSAAASLNAARASIADEHCMGDGKDVDPNHVTIRYGLENEDLDRLRAYLSRQTPFEASIIGVELFPASEHSDGAVPIVARIASPELRAIEAEIGQHADFKEKSFPVYKPHCTLAYCKPEIAERYAELYVDGSFVVHAVTISHASGTQEIVHLGTQKFDPTQRRDEKGRWAAQYYGGHGARAIQAHLKGRGHLLLKQTRGEVEAAIPALDALLRKTPLSHSRVVYRAQRALPHAQPGDVVESKGYLSTSSTVRGAQQFLPEGQDKEVVEIAVPKGTPALEMGNLEGGLQDLEAEVLLPRNSRLRVHSRKHGVLRLVLEKVAEKKDPVSGRYVTPFVSFDKQGDESLRMIASLNSSRLATWGFTAEAEIRGMARYKLTAVLDGRTSKFCRLIDGKMFLVTDARRKVIEVLEVQDPNDLKVVQPWPKQTKQALAEFAAMTPTELTERGLHIPPYHPHCRTICRVVQSSAGESTEVVPTIPIQAKVFHPVTAEDLKELGIEATPEQVEQWNTHVGMTPVELLSKFSGQPPQVVMTKGQGVGDNPIRFTEAGNIGFNVRGSSPQGLEFKLGALLDPFTGTYYLTRADLEVGNPKAELSFMKGMFSALIEMGLKSTATEIAVGVAGNAAYYARLGFLPDELEWEGLRTHALTIAEPMLASLQPGDRLLVEHLLQDKSVDALTALVELPFIYEGKTIGEWLFGGAAGTWALDLTDDLLVAQTRGYLS